jgi:hypothetical protein
MTPESKQHSMELEAHIIANKDKNQAGHFNSQDHVHSFLGQAPSFAC